VREYVYALTAVNPFEGKIFSLVLPWVDTEGMSIFLHHAARAFEGETCIMILDGAGWHRAHELRVPQTMRLIQLPPYSPELNPVEHVWSWLRDNVMKNTAFETLDAVVDTLCDGLESLTKRPDLVRSLTCFSWLNTLSLA
jgi:transposase